MTDREYSMTLPKNIRKIARIDYKLFCEMLSRDLGITVAGVRKTYIKMEEYIPNRIPLYYEHLKEYLKDGQYD